MIEYSQFVLLAVACIAVFTFRSKIFLRLRGIAKTLSKWSVYFPVFICFLSFFGCIATALYLREPVPRIHDEFSYLFMAETFSSGRLTNPTPPLPEFFDTFHELMHPWYASKYFPAQGVLLALGQIITGHPVVGVWLSSAVACAATYWMLEAWVTSSGALLGSVLMVLQIGIFSYWSQSYWGGMVAALGGALFFGAARRLWDEFKWQNSFWLGLGLVILASSRPLEGLLAITPLCLMVLMRLFRQQRWHEKGFWSQMLLPATAILLVGAALTGIYDRAITGSATKTPYLLHEEQYQESPPLIFMSLRPAITYSSFWVWNFYHNDEVRTYESQRTPSTFAISAARKIRTWWMFYCGILLTPALLLPVLLKENLIRYLQIALLIAFVVLGFSASPEQPILYFLIDLLIVVQVGILWMVFEDFWSRMAIVTCCVLLVEICFSKWFFPHYFAPAACLVLYLQVQGLKNVWHWQQEGSTFNAKLTRSERRRLGREKTNPRDLTQPLRNFVLLLPIVCTLSLGLRIVGRIYGWSDSIHGPDRDALLMNDWSLRRAALDKWLSQQSGEQLVFVRYSMHHNVFFEWVYNHPDLIHSHVIWARDLGTDHDQELLNEFPKRVAWVVDADLDNPQLVPFADATKSNGFTPSNVAKHIE